MLDKILFWKREKLARLLKKSKATLPGLETDESMSVGKDQKAYISSILEQSKSIMDETLVAEKLWADSDTCYEYSSTGKINLF